MVLWFSDRNIKSKQHIITFLMFLKVTAFNFQVIKKQNNFFFLSNFFFSLLLSHTTHTHPVSESLNLHNTLHYLSCDALHAALSSPQVFEVTRSSDHLTYFIKNTWDATQTGSPSSSPSARPARLIRFSSIKLPDGKKLPHFIHFALRAVPTLAVSLHVTKEMNTSLHSETCALFAHMLAPVVPSEVRAEMSLLASEGTDWATVHQQLVN